MAETDEDLQRAAWGGTNRQEPLALLIPVRRAEAVPLVLGPSTWRRPADDAHERRAIPQPEGAYVPSVLY